MIRRLDMWASTLTFCAVALAIELAANPTGPFKQEFRRVGLGMTRAHEEADSFAYSAMELLRGRLEEAELEVSNDA